MLARQGWVVVVAVGVALGACERMAEGPPAVGDVETATVTLVPGHCAGVIVEDGRHALTAAHCVGEGEERVAVALRDGQELSGRYTLVDRDRDVAVIRLDAVAPVRPLEVAPTLPAVGEALLFAGRADRPGSAQEASLARLGRCPSLPGVPQALFTTLRGEKGDSGAPLVDRDFRVVGLVHGGAACSIATPTAGFGAVVWRLSAEEDSLELARTAPARTP